MAAAEFLAFSELIASKGHTFISSSCKEFTLAVSNSAIPEAVQLQVQRAFTCVDAPLLTLQRTDKSEVQSMLDSTESEIAEAAASERVGLGHTRCCSLPQHHSWEECSRPAVTQGQSQGQLHPLVQQMSWQPMPPVLPCKLRTLNGQ